MKIRLLLSACVLVLLTSCNSDSEVQELAVTDLYFNSFESEEDFVGFELGGMHDEVPEDGGNQSIAISGGCLWPHTTAEVGPFEDDKNLIVSVIAKLAEEVPLSSASLESFIEGVSGSNRSLGIETTDWKYYETTPFELKAGESVFITLNSGGKISGFAHFDLLRVEEVD